MTSNPREWDAPAYDALPLPHLAWGRGVLDRAALVGHERVLDAGCGTGRDAAALLERHPDVDLVVLDGSRRMLEAARGKLGARATYVHADLARPLPTDGPLGLPVDVVVSVAAFHWLPDHDALFTHLAAVLAPGGRLVSDCGGRGNVAAVDRAVVQVLGRDAATPWHFAGPDETRRSLTRAGFDVADVRLRPDPFHCPDPAVLERYLATVVLGAHLEGLEAAEAATVVREVRLALPAPVVDYVRLEVEASLPA
ncbi:methyltransferase domain-containing protein [Nocardioides perillae]|uniref:Trans-aconitate 2-methyltransferase n=1 Tax=Nocardioides perillae TaxID=1119534 RepID=A0A7Y9RP04_9ACTN|nr:trans-aconitate 2-methyltransferase [Nocardioides perillae]